MNRARYLFRLFNLPIDSTEETVMELFKEFKSLRKVWVATDNGECRGYAFVEFGCESDMLAARKKIESYEQLYTRD